jgi:hypothetical protein
MDRYEIVCQEPKVSESDLKMIEFCWFWLFYQITDAIKSDRNNAPVYTLRYYIKQYDRCTSRGKNRPMSRDAD